MSERVRAPAEQTFTNEEVGKILKRAAGLQREQAAPGATLSRSEIEQIALDAGIDPARVREAIGELGQPQQSPLARTMLGAPTRVVIERVIPGELEARHHEALALMIRRTLEGTSGPGLVSSVGRTLTYLVANRNAPVELSFTPSGGNTVVRIHSNLSNLAGGIFGGIGGGFGGSIGPNLAWLLPFAGGTSVPVGLAACAAFMGATWLGCRMLFQAVAGRQRRRLARLGDELEQLVRSVLAS